MSGQTPQTFAELAASGSIGGWPFGRRDNSASSATPAKEDPTPPAGLDPDLPRVTSDLLPPRVATESPAGQTKSTKYSTEDERRKAISEALKRRHASAANDPSHGRNKRVQTANFQGSLLSLPPQSGGPTTQRQSRPEESASTSSESDSSDVEMMDQLPLVLPDDSNDGDWEEGSQRSDASVDDLPDSQLQTEATEVAATVARRALTNTPSGRPYLRWKGEAMHGALIPDEYEWSPALPGFPWICPVRSCRKLFPGIKQLGGHFVRQHRGCLFHDNMDGTLSLRGTYAKLRDGEGAPADGIPKPGTVISIGALDPTEPPMAAPSLPEQGRHHLGTNQSYSENGSEHSAAQSPAPTLAKVSTQPHFGPPLPGDPEGLWKSLQPYLTNFKGPEPPDGGYVKALLSLPRLRDFDWNHSRLRTNPFMDSKSRDISSLILHVTGESAPKPCDRCASGKGLFNSCVMISPRAPQDVVRSVIGCANCFYHYGQTYCSLKYWGRERANKILGDWKRPQGLDWDPTWEEVSTMDDVPKKGDGSLIIGDAQASSFMPSADSGFELAEPGRKYTEWPGTHPRCIKKIRANEIPKEEGGPRSVYGVLIPAGYTMSRVQGEKPFRCPVRNCPKGCGKLNDLGFHFIRGHYASYLRDRGDGSFDVVGEYAPKRGNIVRSGKIVNPGPPIVVARTRPDGSTEWVPNWENMKRLSQDNDVTAAIPDKTSDVPMDDEVPADAVSNSTPDMTPGMVQGSGVPAEAVPVWPQSTWGQMEVKPEHVQAAQRLWHQKVLPALPGAPSVPQQTVVVELLQWKQQRELHPRPNTVTNELHGVKVREIVATVIQLIGDEARGSDVCTKCRGGSGRWRECVIVPPVARLETQSLWPACASCTFTGAMGQCSVSRPKVPLEVDHNKPRWHTGMKLQDFFGTSTVAEPTIKGTYFKWKHIHLEPPAQNARHPPPQETRHTPQDMQHHFPRDSRFHLSQDMRYHPPQDTLANTRPQIMADVAGLEQTEEGPSTRYQLRTRSAATGYVYTQPPPQPSEALPVAEQPASDVEKHPVPEQAPQEEAVQKPTPTVAEQQQQQQQPPASLISKGEAPDGAVAASGLVIPEAVLEMEEWEVAPGRIREQDPSPETIAFSKSYLSSAHAVDVHEDVAFRVDTIKSGHSFKIEADSHQLRLCSLASGKLRVKIGDEPEFVIGPHGMFKIKAGSSCNVSNRMYIDAILHSTVLNGFV